MEFESSKSVHQLLTPHFNRFSEELWAVALNSQLRLISYELIFKGTVNHCMTHPRDIFRFLISNNASCFILAHNHPSLSILPSDHDIKFTKKILKISSLVEIPIIDHLIFTDTEYFSFSENRLLPSRLPTRVK